MSKTNKKPAPREPKTKAEIPAVVTVRTPTKSVTAANSRELTKGNLPDSSNDGLIFAVRAPKPYKRSGEGYDCRFEVGGYYCAHNLPAG
jgi:hypothetical protein